jgi:DNA-directed RNA polymerase subunit M/transcription elongation factor TFIIS
MNQNFCPKTFSLLEPVFTNVLSWRGSTGIVYPSTPEQTLIASADINQNMSGNKYQRKLPSTAYNPTNLRQRVACDKCGRKVVSVQRLDDTLYYVCHCENVWK